MGRDGARERAPLSPSGGNGSKRTLRSFVAPHRPSPSGLRGERRRNGINELSPPGGSEGYGACGDAVTLHALRDGRLPFVSGQIRSGSARPGSCPSLRSRLPAPGRSALLAVTLRVGRMAGTLSLRLGQNTDLLCRSWFFALAALQAALCAYPSRFFPNSAQVELSVIFTSTNCPISDLSPSRWTSRPPGVRAVRLCRESFPSPSTRQRCTVPMYA